MTSGIVTTTIISAITGIIFIITSDVTRNTITDEQDITNLSKSLLTEFSVSLAL